MSGRQSALKAQPERIEDEEKVFNASYLYLTGLANARVSGFRDRLGAGSQANSRIVICAP